ncbi:MAG: hypothetical protein AAGI90_03870 [Chlamydiota bacterium]
MSWCVFCICFFGALHNLFATELTSSIVEIVSTIYHYDPGSPWETPKAIQRKCTGTFLQNGKILTSYGAVQNAAYIDVHVPGSARLFSAKMHAFSPYFRLALLEVKDQDFFSFVVPACFAKSLSSLPHSGSIYSYNPHHPRLHVAEVQCFSSDLLDPKEQALEYSGAIVQVPAGVFSAGSPVFRGKELIGMADQFVGYMLSPNYAEFISAAKIQDFLQCPIRKTLRLSYQNLDNASLRSYYGLPEGNTGILITAGSHNAFEAGDILLSIDGYPVENDGSIVYEKSKLGHEQFIALHITKDSVTCEVLRNQVVKKTKVSLDAFAIKSRKKPAYYIYAGLVFEPPSSYAQEEDSVILTQILPDRVNAGYDYLEGVAIQSINDIAIFSLKDVARSIEQHGGSYHKIQTVEGEIIILDRFLSDASHPVILEKYGIDFHQSSVL